MDRPWSARQKCGVFTSTPSRASGRCCAPGCARTAASRKTSCRSTSASSSSCTTHAAAAKPCSEPSSPPWSHDPTSPPRNPIRAFDENVRLNFGSRAILFPLFFKEPLDFALNTKAYAIRDVVGDLEDGEKIVFVERLIEEGLVVRK